MRKLTDIEMEEIRADARDLQHSPALKYAFDKMQEECITKLLEAPVGELTSVALHARLKAIEEVRRELELAATIGRTMKR